MFAGTRAENVHLYYDLVKVAVIGDGHCVPLILNVPLKTASRYFVLHKIISLPARISDDIFVQYLLDFKYFGVDNIQRNYVLFAEADLSHCSEGSIAVCSADKAIYNTQIVTSESSLFSRRQTTTNFFREYCSYYNTPTLQRHGSVWVSLSRTATRHSPMLEEWQLDISQRGTFKGRYIIQLCEVFRRHQ